MMQSFDDFIRGIKQNEEAFREVNFSDDQDKEDTRLTVLKRLNELFKADRPVGLFLPMYDAEDEEEQHTITAMLPAWRPDFVWKIAGSVFNWLHLSGQITTREYNEVYAVCMQSAGYQMHKDAIEGVPEETGE